jgi:CRP-like cAMP-binding protein
VARGPAAQAPSDGKHPLAAESALSTAENHLIELLPRTDRRRLLSLCHSVELTMGDILSEPGARTREVYFPIGGFVSLVTRSNGKSMLEVGMVGREGMVGVQVVLGVPLAPLHALVQGSGDAWCLGAAAFQRELKRSAALHRIVNRYLYVLMAQFASSAACIRFHRIDQRLARWLSMTRDRAHADHFRVTHEFLAYMLGVRRVGITTAAGALQRRGLIQYHRGAMTVIDPAALRDFSCPCYVDNQRSYDDLLGRRH